MLMEGVDIKDHEDEEVVIRLMIMNQYTRKLVELAMLESEAAKFASWVVDVAVVEVMSIL